MLSNLLRQLRLSTLAPENLSRTALDFTGISGAIYCGIASANAEMSAEIFLALQISCRDVRPRKQSKLEQQ
jgi:hypothetical protein